jgi:glycosyltransferase involved in cell wall biosynthesis
VSLGLLFLTQTYPRFPGDTSGPFIRDLARALVAGGDRVTVLAPHAEGVRSSWDDDGVEVKSFRYAPRRWEVLGYSRSLSSDERMRFGAALVTPAYLMAARGAVKRALSRGDIDLIQAHWVVPNALAAAGASGPVPLAVGLHGSDVFMAEKRFLRSWVKRALAGTEVLTGCSPELVERVCALGFPQQSSRVIPYGVDVETFSPGAREDGGWRDRLGIPAEAPLLLSVGRMVTKKGYHVLLEILPELLERHSEAHVVLAGGGDLEDEFRRRTEAMAGRVHLPGVVFRDTLPDLYRAANLFVLPAVHDAMGNVDGLPNVILEAMASGLPVVASGISGIPLAIRDGREGLLVREQDPQALLEALDRLMSDGAERRRMGGEARERAVSELTWKTVAARYREAYLTALPPIRD